MIKTHKAKRLQSFAPEYAIANSSAFNMIPKMDDCLVLIVLGQIVFTVARLAVALGVKSWKTVSNLDFGRHDISARKFCFNSF